MSNQIYIDSSISNAQMTIGMNNASTIILGNTNCTTTTYLLNVSNISTNTIDTNASGILNIGNTNASIINIGTLGTGTINIGKANMSTVIQGPLTTNGLIMNTGKNITLQPATGFVVPTNSQLGFFLSSNTLVNTSFTSSAVNIITLTIPTIGYWLLSGAMTFSGSGTGVNLRYSVDSGNAVQVPGNPVSSFASITLPVFVYYNSNASTTIYTQANNNGNTNTVNSATFTAVRIA